MSQFDEKQDENDLLRKWVTGLGGSPVDIFQIVRKTGSYIAGNSLHALLTKGDISNKLEIYATREAAKTLAVSPIFKMKDMMSFITGDDHDRVFFKNGVFGSLVGDGIIIYITDDPYKSINNFVINHSQVYFDGYEIHKEVLDEPVVLNKSYIEEYLRFNTFINKQISYFINEGKIVQIEISPENIGMKLSYNQNQKPLVNTDAEKYKSVIELLYTKIVHDEEVYDILNDTTEIFFLINTFLVEYTFDELESKFNKVKKCFLPEVYEGSVKKLLSTKLAEIYRNLFNLRGVINNISLTHFGVPAEQLEKVPAKPNSLVYKNKLKICQLSEVSEFKNKAEELLRLRNKTRALKNLEFFTKPSRDNIEEFDYNESGNDKCMDIESLSFYDINAYLNGEAVMAYGHEGEEVEESAIEAVPPEVARRRLVFFVASDKKASVVKPICYNLELLEKDLATRIYSDTCTSQGGYKNIDKGFSNPLFKLAFDTPIFVRLSQLLKALYNTKQQAFLLIPTSEVVPRTASLSSYHGRLAVSGDHCQAGTDKRVHRIVVCGKGSDKCYPLRSDIEFRPYSSVSSRTRDNDYDKYEKRYAEEIEASRLAQDNLVFEDELQ